MSDPAALIDVLKWQGAGCAATGSPFSGALLDRAGAALDAQPSLSAVFAPWRDLSRVELFAEAVALRWLGALHDLALEDPAGALAAAYPGVGRPGDATGPGRSSWRPWRRRRRASPSSWATSRRPMRSDARPSCCRGF